MGMWNGVGGKIEPNESPVEGIIRETFEETGITLQKVMHVGDVTWQSKWGDAGMYVFMADLPKDVEVHTPFSTCEGILEWKHLEWILDPNNRGVVDNIKIYLPKILDGHYGLEHKFVYKDGIMTEYITSSLSNKDINSFNLIKGLNK